MNSIKGRVSRFFQLDAHSTTLQREVIGGVTTFFAMSYIIFVQPGVLSQAGMDFRAVLAATCLAGALSTLLMGLLLTIRWRLPRAWGRTSSLFIRSVERRRWDLV